MANSPIVTSLPAYVEERRLPLVAKAVLGARSAQMFNLQTDVKEKSAINRIDTAIEFGDGKACGWDEAGSTTLSQRYIEPAYFKVNMAFCEKNLLGTWAGYQVKMAATDKEMPFEENFTNEIVKNVNAELERIIWQGNKETAAGAGKVEFDGMIKVLTDASAPTVTFVDGQSAYAKIKAVYEAIPAAIVNKEDTVIFVGEDIYREYIQDIVSANLYHYNPDTADNLTYILPGTSVRVVAVSGLNGTGNVVAGQLSNMFYGCDMANDQEIFDLWYSKDNREFRLAIEFLAGVQVAYPDEVVLGKDA